MRTILVFLLVSLGLSACGGSASKASNRSKKPSQASFSLGESDESGWLRINAYGHSFLYPDSTEAIKELPVPKQRWPITISPPITGASINGEPVSMLMTIDGNRDAKACADAKNDREFSKLELKDAPTVKWAAIKLESKRHESGKYLPWLHAFYQTADGCTKVFMYEAELDGTIFKISWSNKTQLVKDLKKVLGSYQTY